MHNALETRTRDFATVHPRSTVRPHYPLRNARGAVRLQCYTRLSWRTYAVCHGTVLRELAP